LVGIKINLFLQAHRFDRAEIDAGSAIDAFLRIADYAVLCQIERELRAHCNASSASQTFVLIGKGCHQNTSIGYF
jgi:hypothetical protein